MTWIDRRSAHRGESSPLRILQSVAAPNGPTRFIAQVVEQAPPDLRHGFFSWRTALTGQYDVFHVHWPEQLTGDRRAVRRWAKRAVFVALLLRLRFRRTAVVRTLHNVKPHDGSPAIERWLMARLDRLVTLAIRLNPTTPPTPGIETVTILHGHYVDRFREHPRSERVPGRIMHFGIIRPYKGIEDLLSVFEGMRDRPYLSLRVVGRPVSSAMRDLVESAAGRDTRVTSRLEFVDDEALVREFSAAELVVLPYREMHNSGVLLVAVSMGCPALVPASPANAALAEEVGQGWVLPFEGDLTSTIIAEALETVRANPPASAPDLSGRDWSTIGRQHADAYHRARELARHRVRRSSAPSRTSPAGQPSVGPGSPVV